MSEDPILRSYQADIARLEAEKAELLAALAWALPLADQYLGVIGAQRQQAGHQVGAYGLYDAERDARTSARSVLAAQGAKPCA